MGSRLFNLKRQLRWSDFGPPVHKPAPGPGQTGKAAFTKTDYTIRCYSEHLPGTNPPRFRLRDDVEVRIRFLRPPSWVANWVFQQSTQEQNRLLNHEQKHYDLVALFVRDMFIDIMQIKPNTFGTAQAVLNEVAHIRQRYDPKIKSVHDSYDNNTNHGLIPTQQTRWDGFVQKAFTQHRNPPRHAPDGTPYKVPLRTVLQQAGISF